MYRRLDDIKKEHFSKFYKKAKKNEKKKEKSEYKEPKEKESFTQTIIEKIKELIKRI